MSERPNIFVGIDHDKIEREEIKRASKELRDHIEKHPENAALALLERLREAKGKTVQTDWKVERTDDEYTVVCGDGDYDIADCFDYGDNNSAFIVLAHNEDYEAAVGVVEDMLAEIRRCYSALDAIYNHNEAARVAVIEHYGLHHNLKYWQAPMHEDELPQDMTRAEYEEWYRQSRVVDGVRVGPIFRKGGGDDAKG